MWRGVGVVIMNLNKIKCKAFKKGINAAASACSRHKVNHLLSSSAQNHLEIIKTREEEFVQRFDLDNMNYKSIERYEQTMVEAVFRNVVLAIQSDNLPEYETHIKQYDQILQSYERLEQRIRENFTAIKQCYRDQKFDEWRGASVIISSSSDILI